MMRVAQALTSAGTTCGAVWESYRYAPGRAAEEPPHVHEAYQICLSMNFPGEYRYRGGVHVVPARSVSILHPGEPHPCRGPYDRDIETDYRLLYLPASFWIEEDDDGVPSRAPFFSAAVLTGRKIFDRLLLLYEMVRNPIDFLQTETMLCETQSLLSKLAGCWPIRGVTGREESAVLRAKRLLEQHLESKISLRELSAVARLSKFHFLRAFRDSVGIPPHAYQIQLRVDRARRLLLAGVEIAQVANVLGFSDQSHFTRSFRAIVGCTPARYTLRR